MHHEDFLSKWSQVKSSGTIQWVFYYIRIVREPSPITNMTYRISTPDDFTTHRNYLQTSSPRVLNSITECLYIWEWILKLLDRVWTKSSLNWPMHENMTRLPPQRRPEPDWGTMQRLGGTAYVKNTEGKYTKTSIISDNTERIWAYEVSNKSIINQLYSYNTETLFNSGF